MEESWRQSSESMKVRRCLGGSGGTIFYVFGQADLIWRCYGIGRDSEFRIQNRLPPRFGSNPRICVTPDRTKKGCAGLLAII